MRKKLNFKIFRCSFRISYLQSMILEQALNLYAENTKEYKEETLALIEELKHNTILKRKYIKGIKED